MKYLRDRKRSEVPKVLSIIMMVACVTVVCILLSVISFHSKLTLRDTAAISVVIAGAVICSCRAIVYYFCLRFYCSWREMAPI